MVKITVHDAEHWITVHPNGNKEEKGTPLLIEGSNGHYVVKGGAGGKLNGKTVKPKSMSKARAGTEGQGESGGSPETKGGATGNTAKPTGSEKPESGEKPDTGNEAQGERTLTYERCQELLKTNIITNGLDSEAIGKVMNLLNSGDEQFKPYRDDHGNPHWSREQLGKAYRQVKNAQGNAEATKPKENPNDPAVREKRRMASLTRIANEASAGAMNLQGHKEAMQAHSNAYFAYQNAPNSKEYRAEMNHHAQKFHEHKKKVKQIEAYEKRKAEKANLSKSPTKALSGKSFAKSSVPEIETHFKDKWNMNFTNGYNKKDEKAIREAYWEAKTPEEKNAVRERQEAFRNHPASRVKGLTPVDINGKTQSAKLYREMLTHLDNTLEDMSARGFDIKTALTKANVHFVAASTGRSGGLAWGGSMFHGAGKDGYFAVSAAGLSEGREQRKAQNEKRIAEGKGSWTVSSGSDDEIRATLVHEMAHALGIREGVDSPQKLDGILSKMFPDYQERRKWIKLNISEYGTSNIKETDAELAALVTRPDYKWGSLPKELEDHVKSLFNFKG